MCHYANHIFSRHEGLEHLIPGEDFRNAMLNSSKIPLNKEPAKL